MHLQAFMTEAACKVEAVYSNLYESSVQGFGQSSVL